MSGTKMLQAIIDGQVSIREELANVEYKLSIKISEVGGDVKKNGKRIDKLGLQLADLEDDAPTVGEVDELGSRVSKLEHQVAKN